MLSPWTVSFAKAASISRRSAAVSSTRATKILVEVGEVPRAGDGHDERLLGQQPRERDLRRGASSFRLRRRMSRIGRFARIFSRREARKLVAGSPSWDRSASLASSSRSESPCRQVPTARSRCPALRRHQARRCVSGARSMNEYSLWMAVTGCTAWARRIVRDARLRQTEMQHLALFDEVLDRAGDVFHRHLRVNAVLVEQIDMVGAQALEGCLGNFLDVRGRAQRRAVAFDVEAELGRDLHLVADRLERFADQLFVGVGPIDFCRIEERHALFECARGWWRCPAALSAGGP